MTHLADLRHSATFVILEDVDGIEMQVRTGHFGSKQAVYTKLISLFLNLELKLVPSARMILLVVRVE